MEKMVSAVFYILIVSLTFVTAHGGPLDDYINMPDPTYSYKVLHNSTKRVEGQFTAFVLNMTSQTWLTPKDSSQPVWWHFLTVVIPDKVIYNDAAFMYITGGSNRPGTQPPDPLQDEEIVLLTKAAVQTGMVGGILKQVPNQPIVFPGDPKNLSRSEDSIIAYTWRHFVEGHPDEPYWLLRMPMTKAAVRAMDTITDFANPAINRFFVAGGSKRGWTTWTTAAVDKRVIGIAPIVLDCLNMHENLHHFYRSLGGWTFAFYDYWSEDTTKFLDDPNFFKMADIIDPFAYRDRLTMPKFIISSGGDEFFLPDDSHYYYDKMQGPTFIRIHPNAEHSMILHHVAALDEMSSFFLHVLEKAPFPELRWDRYENSTHGIIIFDTNMKPSLIKAYEAVTLTADRRDFRLAKAKEVNSTDFAVQPVLYRAFDPRQVSPTRYIAEARIPVVGWKCFFIVAHFPGPRSTTVAFTSEANIIPNEFPFPECQGEQCAGSLV